MIIVVCVVILLVAVLWSASSIAQSMASARQAEAVIQTAHVAQTASMGNLVVILLVALVIMLALALVTVLVMQKFKSQKRPSAFPRAGQEGGQLPDMNGLVTLMTLRVLSQLGQPQEQPSRLLEKLKQDQDEEIVWLR